VEKKTRGETVPGGKKRGGGEGRTIGRLKKEQLDRFVLRKKHYLKNQKPPKLTGGGKKRKMVNLHMGENQKRVHNSRCDYNCRMERQGEKKQSTARNV